MGDADIQRFNMFPYLVFLLFSVQVVFARVLMWMCHSESECLRGYSCHEKVCKKCLKCDMLFRKGNSCTTDFTDCGDCLKGYEEVLITDYSSAIKPCKPVKKTKSRKCTSDNSCPQNHYCNEDSCIQCFDCSLVNRLAPEGNCAKSLNECGICLSGFYEVAVTTNSSLKPCENSIFEVSQKPNSYAMSFSNIALICVLLVLFFSAVLAFVFKKFKGNNLSKNTWQPPVYPSAPPLYTVDVPQNIKKLEETESAVATVIRAEKQQAKVFKQPDAYYYYSGDEASEFNDLSLINNDGALSNSSSWIPATSDQIIEMNCTAGVLIHRYLQLGISDALIDSPSQQFNEIDIRDSVSLTNDSDVIDASEVVDVITNDGDGTVIQAKDPSPNKT